MGSEGLGGQLRKEPRKQSILPGESLRWGLGARSSTTAWGQRGWETIPKSHSYEGLFSWEKVGKSAHS